jgi:hypothetical protein
MRRSYSPFVFTIILCSSLWADDTNDFYSKSAYRELGKPSVELSGEIRSPGVIDFSGMPLRRVIHRESEFRNGGVKFRGAYRYEGYSLFDILNDHLPQKENAREFQQPLDLLLAIENKAGERVVLSWGEIYYPAAEHRIIIAVRTSPVVPILTREEWPLPDHPRLIFGNDLIAARNLDNPSKITVFSAPVSFPRKELKKLYSPQITLFLDGRKAEMPDISEHEKRTYHAIFYGRGKGFHGYQAFTGSLLRTVLQQHLPVTSEIIKKGYFVIIGADGYRIALSYSELCNRNDHAEFLLIDHGPEQDGGRYSVFPGPDFFSDRAIKAVQEIHFLKLGPRR